jgi:hypothetical protein
MRKMLTYILLLSGVMFFVSTSIALAYRDSDIGYVIVRCTVTIDVDVLDTNATAWFVATSTQGCTLSPGQEDVSITSITVVNISTGAVLKYAVIVDTIQRTEDGANWIADSDDLNRGIKGWSLSTDGNLDTVGECILAAVFANARPPIGDFGTSEGNDRFFYVIPSPNATQLSTYTYKTGGDNFDPATDTRRYPSALGNGSGTNSVSPVRNANNPRNLHFYIRTPVAVTDEFPRRFVIRVYATLSGSSW